MTAITTTSIKRDMPNTGEIDVLPVLFWDDFSWVEADWASSSSTGQPAEIMPVCSVDPPTANSPPSEQQWTSLKNQEHIAIRDSKATDARHVPLPAWPPLHSSACGMINSARQTQRRLRHAENRRSGCQLDDSLHLRRRQSAAHRKVSGAWSIPDSKNALKLKITLSAQAPGKEGEAMAKCSTTQRSRAKAAGR